MNCPKCDHHKLRLHKHERIGGNTYRCPSCLWTGRLPMGKMPGPIRMENGSVINVGNPSEIRSLFDEARDRWNKVDPKSQPNLGTRLIVEYKQHKKKLNRALALLKELEWSAMIPGQSHNELPYVGCYFCRMPKLSEDGHAADCKWAAILEEE